MFAETNELINPYLFCLPGACFATAGGMITQLRLVDSKKITWFGAAIEIFAAFFIGFAAHAWLKDSLDDHVKIAASCFFFGLAGSPAIRYLGRKFVPGIFPDEQDKTAAN